MFVIYNRERFVCVSERLRNELDREARLAHVVGDRTSQASDGGGDRAGSPDIYDGEEAGEEGDTFEMEQENG